jgi:hypothetical protein
MIQLSLQWALRSLDPVRSTFEINNICRAAFSGDVRRLAVLIKMGRNPSQIDSHVCRSEGVYASFVMVRLCD